MSETWSVILRESIIGVFENRVLRKIFGSKGAVRKNWRQLHSKGPVVDIF